MEHTDLLRAFRRSLYECLDRRTDALFELTDAILTADAAVPSPAHLSLQPPHRRGWGSLYAPLSHRRIGEEALRKLLARHPLAQSGATPVYAVDVSVWDRCDAEASPERLLLPSVEALRWAAHRCRLGLPVRRTAGLCARELDRSRGRAARPTRPRRQRGRRPADRGFGRSARRRRGRPPVRLRRLLYDPVKVQRALEGSPCQILVRLRAGRRFYGDPSLCDPPEHIGRPRRHRPMMKCSDPSTWPEPSTEHRCEDAGYGAVRVRAWAELHPKVHNHERRGGIHCQDADRARLRPQSGPADEVPGGTRSHRGRCRARRPGVRGRVDECHVQGSSASLDAKTRKTLQNNHIPGRIVARWNATVGISNLPVAGSNPAGRHNVSFASCYDPLRSV